MVEERHQVHVALSVEPLELGGGPLELNGVVRDVRVQGEHEGVPVSERIGRVTVQPARGAVGGDEPRHRGQIIAETAKAPRRVQIRRGRDIVVTRCEKVRDSSPGSELVDEPNEADIPLGWVFAR